jgi:hypothetical protein
MGVPKRELGNEKTKDPYVQQVFSPKTENAVNRLHPKLPLP